MFLSRLSVGLQRTYAISGAPLARVGQRLAFSSQVDNNDQPQFSADSFDEPGAGGGSFGQGNDLGGGGDFGAPRRDYSDREDDTRKKIFVGNLAWATDEHSLNRGFSHLGTVVDTHVVRSHHDQRSRGFGFITFQDESSAQRALQEMEGAFLDGRDIRVQPAKKRMPRANNQNYPDEF